VAIGATALLALAAGTLAALLPVSTSYAATARPAAALMSYRICNGWASCTNKGYNSYAYGAHQAGMYWRMYSGDNCTNYAAYVESTIYRAPTPGYLLGNGGQWASNAKANGVPVNHTPSVGAVAEWNGGDPGIPYPGHVGVVEEVGPRGSWIIVSQQNIWGDTNGYEWRFIRKGSNVWQSWPDNFIHFKIPKRALVGYYNPGNIGANFRDSLTAGPINLAFGLGVKGAVPLVGNWSSTGTGRTGYYDPATATFYLHNVSKARPNVAVSFGPPGMMPLIGDWKGTGLAGPGYYDPATATFYLRQSLTASAAAAPDYTVKYGPVQMIPMAGDWTGGRQDGIGYYNPTNGYFTLLATPTSATTGRPFKQFKFGPPHMVPVVGNWTGTKVDYVGYYDPGNGTFYLKTAFAGGSANIVVHLGPNKMVPLTGDWYGG
jgi:surface antigen